MADGLSPMHQSDVGYPDAVQPETATTMKDQMANLAAFRARCAVRAAPRERMARAQALVEQCGKGPMKSATALALLLLLRDSADTAADWGTVVTFIDGLPADLRFMHEFTERARCAIQRGTAAGSHCRLACPGGTAPDRRRKGWACWAADTRAWPGPPPIRQTASVRWPAIDYERGMELDLNEYYCASNLPCLYRQRNARARSARRTLRASSLPVSGPSAATPPTPAARHAARRLRRKRDADSGRGTGRRGGSRAARWKLESVLGALESSLALVTDAEQRERLQLVVDRLKALVR